MRMLTLAALAFIVNITIANAAQNNNFQSHIQLCSSKINTPVNEMIKLALWNQCTKDDDCGVDHKCCSTNDGTRCFQVDTCAPSN